MATTIASRKPYSFTHITTDLTITITTNLAETPLVTTVYDIIKTSYDELVPVALTVNLSPFASDTYNHTPSALPTTISAASEGAVDIAITGNIQTPQYFQGYDGWERYLPGILGLSTSDTDRNIVQGSKQYISANLEPIDNILWTTDDGASLEVNNPFFSVDVSSIFPVIHPSLTITDNTRKITIQGRAISNVVLWTLEFTFICEYDTAYTIGFINRYGVWEYVDMVGNIVEAVETTGRKYLRYDIGESQSFLMNGNKKYTLNTGWVDDAFKEVVTDLMLSEHIILYTGDESTSKRLTIEDSDKVIQRQRTNKMINYSFNFKEAGPIIKIV